MKFIHLSILCFFILTIPNIGHAKVDEVKVSEVDYVHYRAEIEPNFESKSLSAAVTIKFVPVIQNLRQLKFSSKYKQVKSVRFGGKAINYDLINEQLIVQFEDNLKSGKAYSLKVEYTAAPERGMKFYEDHLFTVYHTKNWLISHGDISDKATFELLLEHETGLESVGNGQLISRYETGQKTTISHWKQDIPIPIYTFGFALGFFETLLLDSSRTDISVLYRRAEKSDLTSPLLKLAFKDVADMLSFFESKAGFSLNEHGYRYVVVDGYMAQEASGFSLVGEKFVHTVLKNKNENWFIAHELAHEWWGNSVTSSNFSHFWLNEGLVVFLVAAYKQHLFGDTAYKNEISVAVKRVEIAVNENRIAPVAFSKVIREQEINHTMAYSKGAIIFYMLREKLGEELFWKALKEYTVKHKDGSVTTQDLKSSFEKTTATSLTSFFDKWVYGEEIPKLKM
ncbi:M1 family aminopeptidase [Thalassotalea montiporae]